MAAAPYILENAGREAWDVFTKEGRFAALLVTQRDGTVKHYYDSNGTKGSAGRFPDAQAALANVDKRLARIRAKRAA